MNDEEVVAILVELDQKEFADLGKAERHGHPMERQRLLELGFSILDDGRMTQFKNLYNKAKGMRAGEIMREETARTERSKKALAARAKKLSGKIAVISRTENAVVEGTTLIWKCPGCRKEEQRFDLTKMEYEKGYLRINGKDFRLRRRRGTADPTRRIIMTKSADSMGIVDAAVFKARSAESSSKSVPIGAGPDSPAINRLGNGTIIVFGFQCAKCGFRQENVEIGMVKQ